jgi:hypothetical protein
MKKKYRFSILIFFALALLATLHGREKALMLLKLALSIFL